MRRIRSGIAAFSVAIIAMPILAHQIHAIRTGNYHDGINAVAQYGNSYLNHLLNASGRPDWLTRTDITLNLQRSYKPVWGAETIQPLFEDCWSTLFWQGRLAYDEHDGTGNFGLGYRYLNNDKSLMSGLNVFYDQTFHYQHRRVGVGAELFSPYVTLRANYYDAISRSKHVGTTPTGFTQYERALSGYDASIETPVPYIPWMRFMAQGYRWLGNMKSNIEGGQAGLRIFPAKQLEIDAGVADDNSNHIQGYLAFNYYLGSPAFIEHSAMTSCPTPCLVAQNLEKMRLQKVLRQNNIIVEKTSSIAARNTPIIIARGN